MAPSRAVAEKLSAPQNFRRLLAAGLILGGLAFLLQNRPVQMEALKLAAPVELRIIDATGTPKPAPASAFNPDAGMSARDMMERWDPLIADAARRYQIPAAWIRNVMRSESGGRTFLNGQPITSTAGAVGLMQVEPGTYAQMAAQYRLGDDPFNPQDNILAGAAYLRWLHGKYGFPAMFAAYNTGPGHLEDHLHHGAPLPAETRAYVAGITRALGAGADWLAHHNKVTVTAPNGRKITLDPGKVRSVRAALPGEYALGVAAVIELGQTRQGVQESPDAVLALIGPIRHGV
jgi:soluble lytic murein transglycosylase-like protein